MYKRNSKCEYHISLFNNYQIVELKYKEKILLKFKDILRGRNDLNSFIRTIDNQKYIFLRRKIIN